MIFPYFLKLIVCNMKTDISYLYLVRSAIEEFKMGVGL